MTQSFPASSQDPGSVGQDQDQNPDRMGQAQRMELARQLDLYCKLAAQASRRSLLDYLQFVVIDSRPEPRTFRQIAEPWQWAQARTLAPGLEKIAGLSNSHSLPAKRGYWLEYPRGHDKSSSIGRYANWLLAFATRKNLRILVAASDKDQAGQIADFMSVEASLNPWLSALVKHQKYDVTGLENGAALKILAADAAGSYGAKPDILIADELTHWPKADLWNALASGMEKRPGSVTLIITNSGVKQSWQHRVLKALQSDPDWLVYQAPGPVSSYMSRERMARIAATLPKHLADRVIWNKWVDAEGAHSFVSRQEAQACADLGQAKGFTRREKGTPGIEYVASVDYGLTKDRTVLTVGHQDKDGHVIIDQMNVWQGSHGAPVQASDVEDWIVQVSKDFNSPWFVVDPYQLEPVIQRLRSVRIERYEYRGGKTNYQAASCLLSLIRNRKILWYPGCGVIFDARNNGAEHTLVDELSEVVTRPMGYGWRIDHETAGHDDRVIGLAMLSLKLSGMKRSVLDDELLSGGRWF